jgi:hypothetical protein
MGGPYGPRRWRTRRAIPTTVDVDAEESFDMPRRDPLSRDTRSRVVSQHQANQLMSV